MSITHYTVLRCDHDEWLGGELKLCPQSFAIDRTVDLATVRHEAAKVGWARLPEGGDACPRHAHPIGGEYLITGADIQALRVVGANPRVRAPYAEAVAASNKSAVTRLLRQGLMELDAVTNTLRLTGYGERRLARLEGTTR